ncbi:MAG: dNTP triphosphohydrolase [Planctomycetes bacterium]|nr:dNTP triphosphohydrolase [Planctomycetota bacterium]
MRSKFPTVERESLLLAPYAMHSADTAGRVHAEPTHPYRGPFQRDRDRIVHSSAYRRLAHKTQVFTGHLGDYHRSRLTHTLEVASIARTIGRVLGLNEDLIEALALMHDIGHPPFGHAGEDVLNQCTGDCGGFNHNRHAVRIVTLLENRYPEFPGLNLSQEVLSGQLSRVKDEPTAARGPFLEVQPLLEVQIVDAADSIAYDSHDADDALELGLLKLDELLAVPLWREAAQRVQKRYAAVGPEQLRRAVIHELIETLVSDLVDATSSRLQRAGVESPAAAADWSERLAAPSAEFAQQKGELEAFLFDHVYRHATVLAERRVAGEALREMFDRYSRDPAELPEKFRQRVQTDGPDRASCDFLAGMTDRYALETHRGRRSPAS